jgi:hypothetical protein
MDKRYSSRKQRGGRISRTRLLASLIALGCVTTVPQMLRAISLTHAEALAIGKKIWQNECNGTVEGLTSWNAGENFASLGIGHFIWYPKGQRGPFEESFPKFMIFIRDKRVEIPNWIQHLPASSTGEPACPWNSRAEFVRDQDSAKMKQLRRFLIDTVDLQTEFLISRLQTAAPKMLAEAAPADRANVQRQFERLASTPQGCYALVDYVNFKGEGVLQTERYQGQGWGLLQVLENMHGTSAGTAAVDEFARSAKAILIRRVQNAPPARGESRWLSGWLQRVNSYTRG